MKRSAEQISAIMRQVRSSGTTPESRFQEALLHESQTSALQSFSHSGSLLTGKPDFWFPDLKLAVFIDGDFWHGRQWFSRGFLSLEDHLAPRSNPNYWIHKIRRNMARDREVTRSLVAQQIHVLRFWESDLKQNQEACMALLKKVAVSIQKFPQRRRKTDTIRRKALGLELQTPKPGNQKQLNYSKAVELEKNPLYSHLEAEQIVKALNRPKTYPFRLVLVDPTASGLSGLDLASELTNLQNRFHHRWDWIEILPSFIFGIGIHKRFFQSAKLWSIPFRMLPGIPLEGHHDSASSADCQITRVGLGRKGRRDLLNKIQTELQRCPQEMDQILTQWAWENYLEPVLTENLRNQVWWGQSNTFA